MAYFPGNIMIIDDQLPLLNTGEPEDADLKNQYFSLLNIKKFCEDTGIPLIAISNTNDASALKDSIERYQNVRLLIIDLDLNDDGSVNPEDDYETIFLILRSALKKYGYFILLINSAHAEAWNNIKQTLPDDISTKLIQNLTYSYDKNSTDNIYDSLSVIGKNYSLEIIYHFESLLNEARDKAFSSFLDFEKESWKKIHQQLSKETGALANNDITNILIALLKSQLLDVKYPDINHSEAFQEEPSLKKLIYKTVNYIEGKSLLNQRIWTGNLYRTKNTFEREYALVINPECDLAQNKHLYIKVVYGFCRNNNSLPEDYEPKNFQDKLPPLLPLRAGKNSKGTWKAKADLKAGVPNNHMLVLPYIDKDNNDILLDFRDVSSIDETEIKAWELILRINEPFITNIIDTYSNLQNRKGLLPL